MKSGLIHQVFKGQAGCNNMFLQGRHPDQWGRRVRDSLNGNGCKCRFNGPAVLIFYFSIIAAEAIARRKEANQLFRECRKFMKDMGGWCWQFSYIPLTVYFFLKAIKSIEVYLSSISFHNQHGMGVINLTPFSLVCSRTSGSIVLGFRSDQEDQGYHILKTRLW